MITIHARFTGAIITARSWINTAKEANPLRRFGQHTEAGLVLRRSFASIWSEILRRVYRNNFLNSRRAMQPPALRTDLVNTSSGQYPALIG